MKITEIREAAISRLSSIWNDFWNPERVKDTLESDTLPSNETWFTFYSPRIYLIIWAFFLVTYFFS